MAVTKTPRQIYDALKASLGAAVTCCYGQKELARQSKPRRLVWIESESVESAGPTDTGGNPRAIADDVVGVDLHIWGSTEADAMLVRRIVLTLLFDAMITDLTIVRMIPGEPDDAANGHFLVQEIQLRVAVLRARLSGTDIVDDANPVAVIVKSRVVAPVAAVDGDGVINLPNK